MDLLGGSLIGDLIDAPSPVPSGNPTLNSSSSEVDLFADATFVSAAPQVETRANSQTEVRQVLRNVDRRLFTSCTHSTCEVVWLSLGISCRIIFVRLICLRMQLLYQHHLRLKLEQVLKLR